MIISNAQIAAVVQAIVENYQPEKVILFGSYASGSAGDDSDLDLAVVKNTTNLGTNGGVKYAWPFVNRVKSIFFQRTSSCSHQRK